MRAWTLAATVAALGLGASACIGTSPEEARVNALGPYDDDGDEEHNPGLPCLACHSRDYSPGEEVFALAGTVYLRASDPNDRGLAGVDVWVTDARGREIHAVTNRAGNFMFQVDGDDERDEGRTRISFWPEYPLEVRIAQGGAEQEMETRIHREGSCATCHDGEPSATSVGRVYLLDEGAP